MKKNLVIMTLTMILLLMQLNICAANEYTENGIISYSKNIEYEGLKSKAVNVDNKYFSISIAQHKEGEYSFVLLQSEDQINWKIKADISKLFEQLPQELELRYLNGYYTAHLKNKNGFVRYISTDTITWEEINLEFQDIAGGRGIFWGLDSNASVYSSSDLKEWTVFSKMPDYVVNSTMGINLSLNDNSIVVSHYNPNWGMKNYSNGLEVLQKDELSFKPALGYYADFGRTIDIAWTNKGYILAAENDYEHKANIELYRSYDGVNWGKDNNITQVLRELNASKHLDSQINILIEVVKKKIDMLTQKGEDLPVMVRLDSEEIEFDQPALLKSGRVYVPVRKIFEVLGGSVSYDGTKKEIKGVLENKTIIFRIGESNALINNDRVAIDAPATIINGRTLVPVRFVSECINKEVKWDKEDYIVDLITSQVSN